MWQIFVDAQYNNQECDCNPQFKNIKIHQQLQGHKAAPYELGFPEAY